MIRRGKHFIVISALVSFLLVPVCSFAGDNPALHAGISLIFGAAGESVLHYNTGLGAGERILYGTLLGSLPGLAKELADSGDDDNGFSGTDMAANVAGAFAGSVIANLINTQIMVSVDIREKRATAMVAFRF